MKKTRFHKKNLEEERKRSMKFKSLKKVHEGKFIARYDVTYETSDGKDKVY